MATWIDTLRLHWTDDLRIGVEDIDAQHRELFARMVAFQTALESADEAWIDATFAFLRGYAATHFAREEEVMRASEYPRLEAHRTAHQGFVAQLAALVRERERGPVSRLLALRARNWIVLWLVDHIGGADQSLGRYLAARDVSRARRSAAAAARPPAP